MLGTITSNAVFCSAVVAFDTHWALAQANEPTATEPDLFSTLFAYFFYFVFLLGIPIFFLLLVRRSGAMKQGKYLERAEKHIEIAEAHMNRVEEQNARMLELLEAIRGNNE